MASRVTASIFIALTMVGSACGKGGGAPASGGNAAAAPAAAAGASSDPRAALFITKGCPQCHSISALGVKSTAEVGPDLTQADEDVQTRFGVKLEEFLPNPTGTMQMVLSQMIHLTPTERDSVIHILKALRAEHEGRERH